jgi:hypothetical protein
MHATGSVLGGFEVGAAIVLYQYKSLEKNHYIATGSHIKNRLPS